MTARCSITELSLGLTGPLQTSIYFRYSLYVLRNGSRGMLFIYKGKGRSAGFSLCQDQDDYRKGYLVYEDKDKLLKPMDNVRDCCRI